MIHFLDRRDFRSGLRCPQHGPIVFHDEGMPYCPECDVAPHGPRWWAHNLLAHPLLILWPRVGEWLHERTEWPERPEFVEDLTP